MHILVFAGSSPGC